MKNVLLEDQIPNKNLFLRTIDEEEAKVQDATYIRKPETEASTRTRAEAIRAEWLCRAYSISNGWKTTHLGRRD